MTTHAESIHDFNKSIIKIPVGHYGLSFWTITFGIFGLAHSCDAVISFVDLVSQ